MVFDGISMQVVEKLKGRELFAAAEQELREGLGVEGVSFELRVIAHAKIDPEFQSLSVRRDGDDLVIISPRDKMIEAKLTESGWTVFRPLMHSPVIEVAGQQWQTLEDDCISEATAEQVFEILAASLLQIRRMFLKTPDFFRVEAF